MKACNKYVIICNTNQNIFLFHNTPLPSPSQVFKQPTSGETANSISTAIFQQNFGQPAANSIFSFYLLMSILLKQIKTFCILHSSSFSSSESILHIVDYYLLSDYSLKHAF